MVDVDGLIDWIARACDTVIAACDTITATASIVRENAEAIRQLAAEAARNRSNTGETPIPDDWEQVRDPLPAHVQLLCNLCQKKGDTFSQESIVTRTQHLKSG